MSKSSLGVVLRESRTAHDLSLNDVAERAGCSPAYVHKLEADRVRTPSPRVLARLAEALGLSYGDLMSSAGYDQSENIPPPPKLPGAVKRYSNAHIVQLLEELQEDFRELKSMMSSTPP
jgi:transcriptional regulator with XRE-family HTH domain